MMTNDVNLWKVNKNYSDFKKQQNKKKCILRKAYNICLNINLN